MRGYIMTYSRLKSRTFVSSGVLNKEDLIFSVPGAPLRIGYWGNQNVERGVSWDRVVSRNSRRQKRAVSVIAMEPSAEGGAVRSSESLSRKKKKICANTRALSRKKSCLQKEEE